MGAEAWESGTEGYLGVFSGARYVRDRGLGFSPEAAPSWDADALFRMDKAGPWPSLDAREQGLKGRQEQEVYLGYLILWLRSPIYYRGLYIVIDKQ